jgi:hypothetical protein
MAASTAHDCLAPTPGMHTAQFAWACGIRYTFTLPVDVRDTRTSCSTPCCTVVCATHERRTNDRCRSNVQVQNNLYRKNSALQKRFPYHQRFKSTHPALHQRKRTRPHTRLLEKRFRLQWPSGAKALARHRGICVRCMCCASVLPALVHACILNMN